MNQAQLGIPLRLSFATSLIFGQGRIKDSYASFSPYFISWSYCHIAFTMFDENVRGAIFQRRG
jgi:hypothetical protein